jgi:pantetheine-phosphate adenylyltransferase
MRRAIYPGSFDPVTNGHLDIIRRSCRLFDEVVIALLVNAGKTPLFGLKERLELLREVTRPFNEGAAQVRVDTFSGLLVQYAQQQQAQAIVRGIRAVADYEYELNMAQMNRRLAPDIETVFLMSSGEYSFVSSRLIKEVYQLGGDISDFVPPLVEARMKLKLKGDSK